MAVLPVLRTPAVALLIAMAASILSSSIWGTTITAFVIVTTKHRHTHPEHNQRLTISTTQRARTTTAIGYEPKWKKKETLAEQMGVSTSTVKDLKEIGIVGTVPVRFTQGNVTKTTMAIPNQPLREVAIQAGQFIKYGCGKGECGTCEALVNGQWIRPCSVNVPNDLLPGQEYVVQVKEVKNKARSSGKFYSVRSFLYGFYNNVLGMIGMVTYKRNAKQNYIDRMEYENLIRDKTIERKRRKALEIAAAQAAQQQQK
jgi:aerobic-type carbon monoxide dehydrogenase small subunit (CoxS/CutS family)